MAYVFTASKPSSIRIACKARFVSRHDDTLITVSSNLIHLYHSNSLTPSHEIPCYGRITTITPFRPHDSKLDHLFVTTGDQKYFTMSFADGQILTGTTGDMNTAGLTTPEMGHRVIVNDQYIIFYVYNGIISVIPIQQNANPKKRAADGNRILGQPQQLRLDELKVHEIKMLDDHGGSGTIFGVLYRDVNLDTQFKSYELVSRKSEIELRKGPYVMANLEHGASMILSRGANGVICVGEANIYTKSSENNQAEYPMSTPTLFNSSTQLCKDQWVLGDDYGILYHLSFEDNQPNLKQFLRHVKRDFDTAPLSIPHVLVALGDKLFLGSHYGDSQLLVMPALEIVAQKTNIGPIQDIIVRPPQGSTGSSSLITASGAYKDGSLKLVKYGVGMAEKAELEVENIRGIWGIEELAIIVVSFIDSYLVLQVSPDAEIEQIDSGDDELIYACAINQKLILVLRKELKYSSDGVTLHAEAMTSVTIAKHYGSQLYVVNHGALEVWTFSGDNISKSHTKKFESEVSALEVTMDVVVIGFWTTEKLWLGTRDLQAQIEEVLGENSVPHSIVLHQLNSMAHPSLLIGMSDGSLISYTHHAAEKQLQNKKKLVLGMTPVSLHVFTTRQGPNVFAVTDRPTIIHASRSKLAFSGISIPSCTYFTSFDSPSLQSCMIVATESGLKIGDIDDIQKLQFKSIPLGELPRRLVSTCGVLGALTMRLEVEQITGNETQRSFLRIFDPLTYDRLDEFELQENEQCQSICSLVVEGNDRIVIGTSFADDESDECTRGRIIVLGVTENPNTLWVESQLEVRGSVYCMAAVGADLVAGVNSFVQLLRVTKESIKELSRFRSSTYALTMAVHDSTILVGDLMKSITYLKVENRELEEIARDYVPTWMTSVSFADSTHFLGAEADKGGLILLQKSDSPLEENKMRLERIGELRYGEMINKLVPGVLVTPEDTSIVTPHSLFGTVDGSIGVIGSISVDYVNLLLQLQTNIGNIKTTVGGLKHSEFRAYHSTANESEAPYRFVDGDLIEEFLELSKEAQTGVCEGLDRSVEDVERIVENLVRLR